MRLPCKRLVIAGLFVASMGWAAARAEEDAAPKRDVAAVRAAAKEYLAALRRGDTDALCDIWTPEGDYVDASGRTFKAREIITQQAGAKAPDRKTAGGPAPETTLRFITADVAIEDGVAGSGTTDDGDAVAGRFTAVWLKRDGRWRLDSLREAEIASPASKDPLQALEWLVGEWVGTTDGSVILVSSRRSNDGHFIVREFADRDTSGSVVVGTQRIGWDASAGKLKCWTFDSQGGSGEGIWRREGNRWIVETREVMPDGKVSANSAVYAPGEDGRFVWEAAGTKVAGTSVPARRVEFKRAAEK